MKELYDVGDTCWLFNEKAQKSTEYIFLHYTSTADAKIELSNPDPDTPEEELTIKVNPDLLSRTPHYD